MATNQISTSPYLLSDSNQASYRYNGELPPEESLEQQALNRRQHIANLLIQQGLAGAGTNRGQMVGRFYVPGSPLQGLGDIAKIGLGAYGTHVNDQSRQELSAANQQMLADAVSSWKHDSSDVPAVAGSGPMPGPQASVAEAMAGQPGPTAPPPQMDQMPMGPPSMPFSGSSPMGPDVSGWEPKGPIQDLNAEASSVSLPQQQVAQAMIQPPMQGPVSPGTPGRARTPEEKRQAIIENLLMNQHPQARQMGQTLLSELDKVQAREDTQAFNKTERQLDREARLQGQEIQLNQALMMGLITKEQKDQMLALQKQQIEQTGELKRAEIDTKKAMLQQGKTPPGYRATGEGNLEAIPGGPADTKLQGVLNLDTSMLQNSNASFDRLATSANQILNHSGLQGITGIRGRIPNIPGTAAADAEALLATLKSQVGFGVLQEMRNNSKSGGALGSVSDAEGKRLENNLAALDKAQSLDQMKSSLQSIVDYATGAKDRLRDTFNMKHKTGEPVPMAPLSKGPAVGHVEGGYRFKGGDPGKAENWEKQ